MKECKDSGDPEVPKLSKALPIIKWTEAFQDYANCVIGTRMIPLSYVIRPDFDVLVVTPPLEMNKPHSEEHSSVEAKLMVCASHGHKLYHEDNASIYYHVEEAMRGMTYDASIKPFQCTKDSWGAWTALTNQYAGKDKWESEIKKQDDLLHV